MKDQYVHFVILKFIAQDKFDSWFEDGWISEDDLAAVKSRTVKSAFAGHGFNAEGKYFDIIQNIFDALFRELVIECRGDEFAGYWFRLVNNRKRDAVMRLLQTNQVAAKLSALPATALGNALKRIAEQDGLTSLPDRDIDESVIASDQVEAVVVPAANRIVSINHNQLEEVELPLNDVLSKLEAENSIDGQDGLRELTIGRLKAGRELIRAGVFELRSLQLTLVAGLKKLVEKFSDHVIGEVASKLLNLLLKQFGIGDLDA